MSYAELCKHGLPDINIHNIITMSIGFVLNVSNFLHDLRLSNVVKKILNNLLLNGSGGYAFGGINMRLLRLDILSEAPEGLEEQFGASHK
jgi:hypothetical protein